MSDTETPPTDEQEATALADQLASLVKGADEFKAEHGSCEVIVGPNSPIAGARIERVAGYRVAVEAVRLVHVSDSTVPATVIDGPLVYFHTDDHPMFGSKAKHDDDWCDHDWLDRPESDTAECLICGEER